MRKLTIQLLGYWLNPRFFIVQWLLIWIIYIYTWLYPLHYFHEIYPRPVPSPLRRNVSLGQRPSGPVGILVPKQPKDGMNGWGQKHIWLNPGRTYYELLWISVFDLLYIYTYYIFFSCAMCFWKDWHVDGKGFVPVSLGGLLAEFSTTYINVGVGLIQVILRAVAQQRFQFVSSQKKDRLKLAFGFSSNGKHCLTRGREINFQSSKPLSRFLA